MDVYLFYQLLPRYHILSDILNNFLIVLIYELLSDDNDDNDNNNDNDDNNDDNNDNDDDGSVVTF